VPEKLQRSNTSPHPIKILCIEDDLFTRQLLQAVLTSHGYHVHTDSSGEEALHNFHNIKPDLVLLDIGLPGLDGLQVCRQLMELANVPVILLTAENREDKVVAGLEAGASDFVTKPYSEKVLLARIQASLRSSKPIRAGDDVDLTTYDDGYLHVNLSVRQVLVRGEKVKLTPTEFLLLAHLIIKAGRICVFRDILESVWGWEYHDSVDYLYTYIRRLRRKLEPDIKHPQYIMAEHGIGYWFQPQRPSGPIILASDNS
jgi:two-component system KDP operon response regulator KdpE